MYRIVGIVVACVLMLIGVSRTVADDYVEEVYYWPDATVQSADGSLVPAYNPRAREIIFIEDSMSAQHPDTVRAIIRELP